MKQFARRLLAYGAGGILIFVILMLLFPVLMFLILIGLLIADYIKTGIHKLRLFLDKGA